MIERGDKVTIFSGKNAIECKVLAILNSEGTFMASLIDQSAVIEPGIYTIIYKGIVDEAKVLKKQDDTYLIACSAIRTAEERRKAVRYPFTKKVKMRELGDNGNPSNWMVSLGKDLSGTGICLYIPKMVAPKNRVEISLPIENLYVNGIVRWLRRGKRAYQVGIEFDIDEKTMERIIRHLTSYLSLI